MQRDERNNDNAIRRGLKWLTTRRNIIEERGMINLLKAAEEYAISIHDRSHFGHRITGDSHGWALVKNGTIVSMGVNQGKHGQGKATKQLEDLARRQTRNGYTGIVLASMTANRDNGRPIIFETEFEMDVLNSTADDVRSNFSKYFRRIG